MNTCTVRRKLAEVFVTCSCLGKLRKSGIHPDRRKASKNAFEKLWVAGTLGAFFTGFYQAIARDFRPHALRQFFSSNAADHLVRYWYFFWLLGYFFVSNFRNEREDNPAVKDLVFDVIQSASALTAVVFLGFIGPNAGKVGFGAHDYVPAIRAANLGIGMICLSSLVIFGCDVGERSYNFIRFGGIALTLLLIAVVSFVPRRECVLLIAVIQLLALSGLLMRFLYLSLTTTASSP